jgi:transketolase
MAEGSVWWALDKAAHYRLGNLTAIVDVNQRGLTELDRTWTPADAALRRSAAPRAWWTDRTSPRSTWRWLPPRQAGGPAVVLAKTAKGKGSPEIEDQNGWHGRVRAAAGSGSARCTACPAPAPGRTDGTRRITAPQTAAARPRPDGPLKPAGPCGVSAGVPGSGRLTPGSPGCARRGRRG